MATEKRSRLQDSSSSQSEDELLPPLLKLHRVDTKKRSATVKRAKLIAEKLKDNWFAKSKRGKKKWSVGYLRDEKTVIQPSRVRPVVVPSETTVEQSG